MTTALDKINDLLTQYETDMLDNIAYDNMRAYFGTYKKMNVYNKTVKKPLQKIWLRTPKFKVFKHTTIINTKNKSAVPLSVAVDQSDKSGKKFVQFIKKIEQNVEAHLKTVPGCEGIKLRSTLKKINTLPTFMTLQMPYQKTGDCAEFSFHLYNNRNQRISVRSLDAGCYISTYVELTDVWLNDTEFGFNWNILQMKVFPEFDFTKCLFVNDVVDQQMDGDGDGDGVGGVGAGGDTGSVEQCYHCMYCPNMHVRTHMCGSVSVTTKSNNETDFVETDGVPAAPPMTPPAEIRSFVTVQKTAKKSPGKDKQSTAYVPTVKDLLSVKLRPVKKKITPKKNRAV